MDKENREKEIDGADFDDRSAGVWEEEQGKTPSDEAREAMQLENIIRSGAVITRRGDFSIHTVTIIGQIEGHYQLGDGQKSTKYEHLIPLLVASENSEAIDGSSFGLLSM